MLAKSGIVLLSLFLVTPDPVKITTQTTQGFEPIKVEAKIRVEPDERNYVLCVVLSGSNEYFRSSCWGLDGMKSPVFFYYAWPALAAGEYRASAWLYHRHKLDDAIKSNIIQLSVQPRL